MAPAPPIAMIGISARPSDNSGKMLHQLREQAEGATPLFLLQRMSPLMARRRSQGMSARMSAFGGKPDSLCSLRVFRSLTLSGPRLGRPARPQRRQLRCDSLGVLREELSDRTHRSALHRHDRDAECGALQLDGQTLDRQTVRIEEI